MFSRIGRGGFGDGTAADIHPNIHVTVATETNRVQQLAVAPTTLFFCGAPSPIIELIFVDRENSPWVLSPSCKPGSRPNFAPVAIVAAVAAVVANYLA